ncbi:TPA: YjcQ family protein [Clostridium perfringens]|uniref:YjcQ family protein n=1 Tax=Clostridium perfringens TaxID=1502 RepID=UPI000F53BD74|nr:YjcQ family protein [Clostridium perfringens]
MDKKKLRYAILKEIDKGNTPLTEFDFEVEEREFNEAVWFLMREGYLIGVYNADNKPHIDKIGPRLTEKGETFLEENSTWSKLYKGLKEIKDWIK